MRRELRSVTIRNPKNLDLHPIGGVGKMPWDAPHPPWVSSCCTSGLGAYCSYSQMNNGSQFFQKRGSGDFWSASHGLILCGEFTWDVIWEKLLEGFEPVCPSRIFLVPCIYSELSLPLLYAKYKARKDERNIFSNVSELGDERASVEDGQYRLIFPPLAYNSRLLVYWVKGLLLIATSL